MSLPPFVPVDALSERLSFSAVPEPQIASGAPQTGVAALGHIGDVQFGIWELTGGGMHDVEVDEVFVVLEGEAAVTLFEQGDPARAGAVIHLRPGTVCRLAAGSVTRWDVPRTLRKIYLIPNGPA